MLKTLGRPFNIVWFIALILVVVALDQLTKLSMLAYFSNHPMPYKVLPIFNLVLLWNRGVSWGLFNNMGSYNALIFSGLSALISVFLGFWLWRAPNKLIATALSLILGGAIGNMIDRLRFGGVVDFLHFHWHSYSFPAFNIADSAITIAVGLMILEEIKRFKREKAQ